MRLKSCPKVNLARLNLNFLTHYGDKGGRRVSGGYDRSESKTVNAIRYARQQRNIAYARVNEAEANISSSQATYEIAELERSYASIVAPFDGTITRKHVEVGNYLQQGQTVVEMLGLF